MFTNFRPSDAWENVSTVPGKDALHLVTPQGEARVTTHPPEGMEFVRGGCVWLQAQTNGKDGPIRENISLHACIESAQYEAEQWLNREGRTPRTRGTK